MSVKRWIVTYFERITDRSSEPGGEPCTIAHSSGGYADLISRPLPMSLLGRSWATHMLIAEQVDGPSRGISVHSSLRGPNRNRCASNAVRQSEMHRARPAH